MLGGRGIPEDILKEILVWLPVKSLIRLKCASKHLDMLIKSQAFITSHMIKQRRNDGMLLVRRILPPSTYNDVFSFHDVNSPELEEVLPKLPITLLSNPDEASFNPNIVDVLGPCNGIVCITGQEDIILCNPALREFRKLPSAPISCRPPCYSIRTGGGFGSTCTNNFKVILMNTLYTARVDGRDAQHRIHLYNSNNDSWREINDFAIVMPVVFSYQCSELFFKGACHWNGRTSGETTPDVILTFDVSTEVFGQFEHPSGFKLCTGLQHNFMILNECFASVRSEVVRCLIEVWVMKEYGIKQSWTKKFVIGPHEIGCPFLFWRNNEELLGDNGDGQLASFVLHTNEIKTFEVYAKFFTLRACLYKESLVSIRSAN
uniref:S locus F-box (SLF)-S4D protein n=1 Tax=Antirrhinum hispanicum TaxID=49039 RepID=Q70WR6_ANTHI|nr:S locus F-box (SLF)-S4D protein [Antirrhinum hispanicum]